MRKQLGRYRAYLTVVRTGEPPSQVQLGTFPTRTAAAAAIEAFRVAKAREILEHRRSCTAPSELCEDAHALIEFAMLARSARAC